MLLVELRRLEAEGVQVHMLCPPPARFVFDVGQQLVPQAAAAQRVFPVQAELLGDDARCDDGGARAVLAGSGADCEAVGPG